MKAIFAGFGLVAMLAGCVPPPQYGMAPSPPQQAQTSDTGLPEQPEFKPMPATDVRRMKCSTLNSASDDDKAYASTFLLGYRSGMVHSHVLDTRQIDTVVQAAVAECAAKPEESAYKVFATAQIKAAMAEHPAHHALHHSLRTIPAAASPTPASPSQSPPLQYVPSPVTPMDPPSGEKASNTTPATPAQPAEKAAQPDKSAEAPSSPSKPEEGPPPATAPTGDGSKQ